MNTDKTSALFRRMDEREYALCLFCNRTLAFRRVQGLFVAVSRLGNGVFWYGLVWLLPFIYPNLGLQAALHMAAVGLVGLVVYKVLKRRMVRQRPYMSWNAIRNGTAALDLYSFPSGHTLHAVGFSMVALWYFPELGWLLIPFSALVALSRVVLGLHYPTDVLVGGAIGGGIALASLHLVAA